MSQGAPNITNTKKKKKKAVSRNSHLKPIIISAKMTC